jgi:hypothetical protein
MPRNYNNTVIYKIVCKDLNVKECYVGNTTFFTRRKSEHKSKSKVNQSKVYQFVRDNGGWNNFDMIEIEKFPCKDGNEARCRERYWYETLNATLNTVNPIITQDREEQNKKTHSLKCKVYYKKNIDKIKAYREQKILCECGAYFIPCQKTRHLSTKKHTDLVNNKMST